MKTSSNSSISATTLYAWIAVGTGLLLLVPYVAMQFTDEVNWAIGDFLVMGLLLYSFGCLSAYTVQRTPRKYRISMAMLLAFAFLYVWAELAVGLFFNLGS